MTCGATNLSDPRLSCTKDAVPEHESHWDETHQTAWASVIVRPTKVQLDVRIENHYASGTKTDTTTIVVNTPDEGVDIIEDEDWSYDEIFPHTGTGKTKGDAAYFVEVLKSSADKIIPVGTEWEFGL